MNPQRIITIRPPLRTSIEVEGHACVGNGKPYPKEVREMVIQRHLSGLPQVDDEIIILQEEYKYPSLRTIRRWIRRYEEHGHILPFRRTGNRRARR